MNTKDTPFGESFGNYGDPRRYMNKGISPGKKVEQFVAKVRNSPLASLMGIGAAGDGTTAPSPVPAPAPTSALGQGVSVPGAPSIGVNANIPGAVAPGAAPMPQAAPSVMPTQDLDGDGQIDSFWGVKPAAVPQPASAPQSSVDVKNPTDFNPLAPDTSNQFAVSGNDYQQIPGFGSAQDKAGKLMKIMGMG
jgi:hypothetical protein